MNDMAARVHAGLRPEGVEIVDLHAHLGPFYNMHTAAHSAPDMLRLMDRCGIARAVISPNVSWGADFVLGNDLMLEAVRRHPGRLYGACTVNGNYPDLSTAELERCFADPRVVMIKTHPFYNRCAIMDRRLAAVRRFADERKLFVLVHSWVDGDPFGSLEQVAAAARETPNARWVMGHSGGPMGSRRAVEVAREVPNTYLDITLSMCPARQIEYFVREVGAERVLFGTDNPFIDPRPQVGRVALADVSPEDKAAIFGGNARRFIEFV